MQREAHALLWALQLPAPALRLWGSACRAQPERAGYRAALGHAGFEIPGLQRGGCNNSELRSGLPSRDTHTDGGIVAALLELLSGLASPQ